tara:strand:- start:2094 stop:2552 length:459 start_codon:yes stop_codon:yes gene_type:complete
MSAADDVALHPAFVPYFIKLERLLARVVGASLAALICVAIYANFFANHYVQDMRWPLSLIVLAAFWKTKVEFTVTRKRRAMPMVLAFFLIGFFIWVAENIATFFGGWVYPDQAQAWAIVGPNKITSWMLLVIISFIIVAGLKQVFPTRAAKY